MAVDSKGNLYIGETLEGRRVQRFLYKGLRAASAN
jgi:sugar lactone lactonase YvrE